jgi:hypothetical protein
VRGGTYFLCCAKESKQKKGASHHSRLSVALEGLSVTGATLSMLWHFFVVFEHHSLRRTLPTRFATSALKTMYLDLCFRNILFGMPQLEVMPGISALKFMESIFLIIRRKLIMLHEGKCTKSWQAPEHVNPIYIALVAKRVGIAGRSERCSNILAIY